MVTRDTRGTRHRTRGLTLYLVEKTLSLGQLSSWVAAATEAGCLASSVEGGLLELQTNHWQSFRNYGEGPYSTVTFKTLLRHYARQTPNTV